MKKLTSFLLLVTVVFFSESFTGAKVAREANPPSYNISIDGAPFEARQTENYSAQLINDSKTASVTLIGAEVHDKQGHVYPSKIQIDYTMRDEALGEVNVEKVTYEYNNQKYNLLTGSAYMSITKMKWSADRKSAVMCADVFCKVQKEYVMEEFVPVFVIRGQLLNLKIVAPAS